MAHPSTTFRFLAEPTKCYCVTVSSNGIRFIKPIKVGQLVEITASLVHTGASSMHIYVVVKSGDATENTTSVANRCFITFMAVNVRNRGVLP